MQCVLYGTERCRSCQWITQPVADQLFEKTADLQNLLAEYPIGEWCTPVSGPGSMFHNKVKMVASGSVEKPPLGVLHRDGTPEDLCDCPLYPEPFTPALSALKPFITRAGLTLYNAARKHGELRYLLLTESRYDGGMMLRFILHSDAKMAQLRTALPWLQAQLPQLKAITVNIQPVHMAIMGGEAEIFLTEQQALAERFNDVPLQIRPQSFFQTNPVVTGRLHVTAYDWMHQLPVNHMWDLFCGVGGFSLRCTTPQTKLAGIEVAPEVITCTKQSARELGLQSLHLQALDSTQFTTAQGEVPDLVLVDPPRRGIGKPLCDFLSRIAPRYIVYSSCNTQTMAKNICELPGYRIERA